MCVYMYLIQYQLYIRYTVYGLTILRPLLVWACIGSSTVNTNGLGPRLICTVFSDYIECGLLEVILMLALVFQ